MNSGYSLFFRPSAPGSIGGDPQSSRFIVYVMGIHDTIIIFGGRSHYHAAIDDFAEFMTRNEFHAESVFSTYSLPEVSSWRQIRFIWAPQRPGGFSTGIYYRAALYRAVAPPKHRKIVQNQNSLRVMNSGATWKY